jgi:hypothetical protein
MHIVDHEVVVMPLELALSLVFRVALSLDVACDVVGQGQQKEADQGEDPVQVEQDGGGD